MNDWLHSRTGFTVLLIVLIGVTMGLTFMDTRKVGTCSDRADTVLYTKSLGSDRLSRLYHDMETLFLHSTQPNTGHETATGGELAESFADLKIMELRPSEMKIVVENCPSYFVHLNFFGMNPTTSEPSDKLIVVRWGDSEGLGEEVLWRGD